MAHSATRPPPGDMPTRKSHPARLRLFYGLIAALLLTLTSGLVWQQLLRGDLYHDREKTQSLRRIIVPGPRGSIFDREGRLLVGNRPRFAVTLALDELHAEFRREYLTIRKAFRDAADKNLPPDITRAQLDQLAQVAVVQRYLDQVNAATGRHDELDQAALLRHNRQQQLLPYLLVNDLAPQDYARLIEQLPVGSPLQVYAASTRYYPYGVAAAHTLGFVGTEPDAAPDSAPDTDLTTFKIKGSVGRDGLEKSFDTRLQGQAGETVFRIAPSGYRLNPPLEQHAPVAGENLVTSLDLDLQLAAEQAIGEETGAAVALDVHTGEVLVLASKPGYDLTAFTPRLTRAASNDIETRQAWINRAIANFHPPGSTFKLLTTIAALRAGALTPDSIIADCQGSIMVSGRKFTCDNGDAHHGELTLSDAIAQSCDIYFYTAGLLTTAEVIATEARRFHLDRRTGIELPGEPARMTIPDAAWKKRTQKADWFPGDTANMAIGQGYVLESPLNMACFVASIARGEVFTQPTLVHNPQAPTQHHEAIGLTPLQRAALLDGMEGCTTVGTAKILTTIAAQQIPGLRIAGKTGTAQIPGNKNAAWFICFAPLENPQIAIAVMLEGDTPGESFGGGRYAAPVAQAILRAWVAKQAASPTVPHFLLPPATATTPTP